MIDYIFFYKKVFKFNLYNMRAYLLGNFTTGKSGYSLPTIVVLCKQFGIIVQR